MKTVHFIIAAIMAGTFTTMPAQITKEQFKQRSEMMGLNRKLQEIKVSKDTRKQAKQLVKEGWKVAPGGMSIEKQLARAELLDNSFEEDGVTQKYAKGDATSTAESYDAGKMQALELARLNLVSSIETDITELAETNRSNKDISADNAASVIKVLRSSKSFVSKKLGQTNSVIEMYRELPNGNVQVRVQTYYSMDKAREIAKAVVREELEKQGEEQLDRLDDIFGK